MASTAMSGKVKSLEPDWFEKILGLLSLVMLAIVVIAVSKGSEHWHRLPLQVWIHLATISFALLLTPILMWRKRGDRLHRQLGWAWTVAMFVTAAASFSIRYDYHAGNNYVGSFSWIHILSTITIIAVPTGVYFARKHNVSGHRTTMRSIIAGALLTAGFFTLPFDRMLGNWLLS